MRDKADMDGLRIQYREILWKKLAELEALDKEDAGFPNRVRDIAHSLAGSAGTYGYAEFGESARGLEESGEAGLWAAMNSVLEGLRLLALKPDPDRIRPLSQPAALKEGSRKVLLAEDDVPVASIIIRKLQTDGYEVIHVSDGDSVMATALGTAFALFIFDVSLPGRDGFALLSDVKSDPSLREIPVLMLTGKRKDDDVKKGISLGANDYMVKPFKAYELLGRVRKLAPVRKPGS